MANENEDGIALARGARHVEVATVPIRRAPKNALFMRQSGGDGRLPDGRKFDIGSTCGLGGVSLVVCVYSADGHSGTGGPDGGTFLVDGQEMIEALHARGLLAPEVISGPPAESDRARLGAVAHTLDALGLIVADMAKGVERMSTDDDRAQLLTALGEVSQLIASAHARAVVP